MKKNRKILGICILSAFAIATTIAVPVSLTVNYDSLNNKVKLSNDSLVSIWDEVEKQVSSLTDLNDVKFCQNILVDKINEILKNSGIYDTNVTSVNITLSPSIDGTTQIAKPVTINFSNNITGESEYFDINSNQLISKNPIQTGILNNQTPDGFDLSSVNAQIYEKITSVVNSSWTDINNETSIEAGLVDAINSVVEPLGGKVTSVDITLINGDTYKDAMPITITFEQNITGTYDNFTADGTTLVTNAPIQTGISKFMSPDGIIIPEDVQINIWNTVTGVVNESWDSINQKSQIESNLVPAIQQYLDDAGVPLRVASVSIQLIDNIETSYKDATPITITFDQNVAGNYNNFEINSSNKTQLISTTPIQTGISIYYSDNGNIIIPEVALNSIKELLSNICERYWNINNSDPATGLDQYYDTAISEANSLLPNNFPMTIYSFGKWGNNLTPSPSGKMIANITLHFIKDGQTVNNFEIPSGLENDFSINNYDGINYLVVNNISTNVDCLYFTTSIQEQLLNIIRPYVKSNWNSNTTILDNAINKSDLISRINQILPIDPSVMKIVNNIGNWGNQFRTPPTPEDDSSYKWVQISLDFEDNWPIGCDNSPYVFSGTYQGSWNLIVWVQTNIPN